MQFACILSRMDTRFAAIRTTAGLTQNELAVKHDISVRTISTFETGDLHNPSIRTTRKLAEAYGVSIEEIAAACPKPVSVGDVREPQGVTDAA